MKTSKSRLLVLGGYLIEIEDGEFVERGGRLVVLVRGELVQWN